MKQLIFKTNDSIAPLFLRIFLAIVLFPHGAQKLFGWFGGYGFAGTMDYFKNTTGIPWILGFLVIVIEFLGPIALLLGYATRLWSIAICIVMTGIILTTFTQYFFMNWFGVQKTEGAEYFLLAIGMSLSLSLSGAGRYSVDARIWQLPAISHN
ncbi:DoxX family protein [Flavitalea sp. BT771]|uniref:DoxX family protein n=1 Tax=Flavitalea sp. BT771 TaxID=3063329 RepID=UPI0026E17EC9|nr:DoxX family protein [Flavitalea sp. BT771]MDO6431670.1 DoxX family protein [Flavitalea sp. BT771]MDV6220578.1 DoxX family protein [Flavitalea sp. BT771]